MGAAFLVGAAALGYLYFAPKSGEERLAVCSIVVDRTGSSLNDEVRDSYLEQARRTVDGCRDKQADLTVFYFENEGNKLKRADDGEGFALYRPMTRRARTGEEMLDAQIASANQAVESVFDSPGSSAGHGSDILTALKSAAEDLQSEAGAADVTEKYLVLLTDGFQTGQQVGVQSIFTSPSVPVSRAMTPARALGLPDLEGVQVSFVGVGGGIVQGRARVPAWFDTKVEQFWKSVVEGGGGQMCRYDIEVTSLPGSC